MSTGQPLAGKVVAITGASRGIGRATAVMLTEAGARVALIARPSAQLDETVAAIPDAIALPTDISDPDQVRGTFARLHAEAGRLDALVNNAAVGLAHRIEDVTDEDLAIQIGTNLLGTIHCTREAIPMLRDSRGTIINVSSEAAQEPFPFLITYGATKAAVEAFSRGLLQELKPDGIRVTLLVSGLTDTGGFSARWDPDVRAAASKAWEAGGYLARVAGAQPQRPEDVAATVLFVLTRPPGTMVDEVTCRAAHALD